MSIADEPNLSVHRFCHFLGGGEMPATMSAEDLGCFIQAAHYVIDMLGVCTIERTDAGFRIVNWNAGVEEALRVLGVPKVGATGDVDRASDGPTTVSPVVPGETLPTPLVK